MFPLEKPFPRALLTMPSCSGCNGDYSKDEEYVLAVIAQTGFVPSLRQKVEKGGVVDRMLERSAGLENNCRMREHPPICAPPPRR